MALSSARASRIVVSLRWLGKAIPLRRSQSRAIALRSPLLRVKMTARSGPVLVNLAEVVRIMPAGKGGAEVVFTDGAKFLVQHTLEEIGRIIEDAEEREGARAGEWPTSLS
jgi:hypothetical protein